MKRAPDDPEPVISLPDQSSDVISLRTETETNPEHTKTDASDTNRPREAANGSTEPELLRELEQAVTHAVSGDGDQSEDDSSEDEQLAEDFAYDILDDGGGGKPPLEDFRRATEPWPEPVDGERLFVSLVAFICRFMVLERHYAVVIALWVMTTYLLHKADLAYSPRLVISAPSGNSGKSTLLDLLVYLVRYAWPMAHVTAPNYRDAADKRRTIFIDEGQDVLGGRKNEVVNLIKIGHSRTQAIVHRKRTVRGRPITDTYRVFTPCVVSGIGDYCPNQIKTRALGIIKLKRKMQNEIVESFSPTNPTLDHMQAAREYRMQMTRWAQDNHENVRTHQPVLSRDLFNNRNRDNAWVMMQVAESLGPVAGEQCRKAIEKMVAGDVLDQNEMLLGDIAAILNDPEAKVGDPPRQIGSDGVVFSADLCMLIQEYFPHRPAYVGFTQSKLAEMLSGFDIAPENRGKRRGSQVLRYYRRSAFDDWFRRYSLGETDDATASEPVFEPEAVETDSDATDRSSVAPQTPDAARPNAHSAHGAAQPQPNVHTPEGVAEVYSNMAAAQAEKQQSGKNWWTPEYVDYLITIHTEDYDRTNDELARMCSERFGRGVNTNMITGKLNTLRLSGRIPRYRPGHERKAAAEPPETATPLPDISEAYPNAHIINPGTGGKRRYLALRHAVDAAVAAGEIDPTSITFVCARFWVMRNGDASFWLYLTDDKLERLLISGLLAEEGVVRINDETSLTLADGDYLVMRPLVNRYLKLATSD